MPIKLSPRKLNVVQALNYNELGLTKNPYRQNLRIISSLVKSKETRFKKIWKESSKKPIIHSDGKIYMNDWTSSLALCGISTLPSHLYRLQKNLKFKRFEDILVYTAPINRTPLPREDFRPFFLGLTSDNWLIRYDNVTGKVLQEIYLGSKEKLSFLHVDWETQGETIVLQSKLFPGSTRSSPFRVVQAMAMFSIFPMKFLGLFEIDQESFGTEVNSANVSEGLLILGLGNSSTNKRIRLYSLHQILEDENKLFSASLDVKCDDLGGGKVGQYPHGLPINYKVKKTPPVLLEVTCSEQILHFGGYPWHYVTSPPKNRGVFEIRNLATNHVIENGNFDFPNDTTEPDNLAFHLDDSGRLVYESSDSIQFFKLFDKGNQTKEVKMQFELKVESDVKTEAFNGICSREASRNANYNSIERTILCDDYENELEFYNILGIDRRSETRSNGKIIIFDNDNGSVIKKIDLGMSLDEVYDYKLIMDLDTFIVTCKRDNTYDCILFRMTRDLEDDDRKENGFKETPTKPKRRRKARKYY